MRHIAVDALYTADQQEVGRTLPALVADSARGGQAAWVGPAGLPTTRTLVLGAGADALVDAEGVRETARFLGTTAVVLEGVAHDVMLDSERWQEGAEVLQRWLERLGAEC